MLFRGLCNYFFDFLYHFFHSHIYIITSINTFLLKWLTQYGEIPAAATRIFLDQQEDQHFLEYLLYFFKMSECCAIDAIQERRSSIESIFLPYHQSKMLLNFIIVALRICSFSIGCTIISQLDGRLPWCLNSSLIPFHSF